MIRYTSAILLLFLFLTASSCVNKKLTIESSEKLTVSTVNSNALGGPGKALGTTPVTIALDTVQNEIIKIEGEGKLPQYIFITDLVGEETTANIDLLNDGQVAADDQDKEVATANLTHRLLLQAYQALTKDDYTTAKKLATKITEIQPRIAAPLIIQGIAFMQEGNMREARASLQEAKALDPEDNDIDQLLKILN